MRLIILPSLPVTTNGYGIAVKGDISKLSLKENDIIVYYVVKGINDEEKCYKIERFPRYSFRRLNNLLMLRSSTELSAKDIKKLPIDLESIDEIFCGEVVFYRALRSLFPNKKITVRFHNCYARIYDRLRLLERGSGHISMTYIVNLKLFYRLERKIFNDTNTYKIFISDEDRNYYVGNSGRSGDSEVWGFVPDLERTENNRVYSHHLNKIVWYGGLDSHKIDSVKWFASEVFSKLQNCYPQIEFHLFGKGTDSFDNKSEGVYGHGFFDGDGMPFKNDALYINPDLTGGGVKIKLITYFESGVRFLTTPFGFEGYNKGLIDNRYCYVRSSDEWLNFLMDFFSEEER